MNSKNKFLFRLYVTGNAPNSIQAMGNLRNYCREYLADRHEIEIVDLLLEPQKALADHILLTPTLVQLSPKPTWKIIGNLNDSATFLRALGLESLPNGK